MKRKTKLIATIMSICLVCAVFAIGVFALRTANLKIGGDVSFSATGVEADIKNVTLTGATTNDQVLATGSINTSMTQADIDSTFQNWQTLKLDFDENATDIELKFDIANTSTNADNYIEIDYSYTFSNTNPNVDVFPGDENDQSVWKNNNYILAPKGNATDATYSTFTLKFRVLDNELNVPQDTKVSVNIDLKHTTPAVLDENGYYNDIKYTLTTGTKNTAAVSGFKNTATDFNIPAVVSNGSNIFEVTSFADNAFQMCPRLTSINIPNSVIDIGDYAFALTGFTSVVIPNSVLTIGEHAFTGCSTLESVKLSDTLTNLSEGLFGSCAKLTSIIIPSTVSTVSKFYANYDMNLSEIIVNPRNAVFDSRGGCNAIIETATNKLLYGTAETTIPSSVTSIGNRAFSSNYSLTSITIQKNIETIEANAFADCANLETVVFEDGMKTIGNMAFAACGKLTSITIPSSVISMETDVFMSSGLDVVTIDSQAALEYGWVSTDVQTIYINEDLTIEIDESNLIYDGNFGNYATDKTGYLKFERM
ncbi:MAG: leucine-rich repeat domain-containing protein [Clostridia bacterium]|nr:leucine-rich repeat domain-containing protein [Clostridia bacterium]